MTAELISVGTEILMGNILNSNARYLAEKCASLGLDMYYQVTVGDNYDRMMAVVKTALGRSDIVIVTGGLGPTEDDLTKEVCAEAMGMELEEDPHTRACLEAFFKNNIYKEIPENNWKMITIPHGSVVLDNPNGMAPGLIMEKMVKPLFYFQDRQMNCILYLKDRYFLIWKKTEFPAGIPYGEDLRIWGESGGR